MQEELRVARDDIDFNFEINPKLSKTFNEDISLGYLIAILSHIAGRTIIREKTLIVFDEVQLSKKYPFSIQDD